MIKVDLLAMLKIKILLKNQKSVLINWTGFSHCAAVYRKTTPALTLLADIVIGGLMAEPKNLKTPFFLRYPKFLLMSDWNWSKNALIFFVLKNLNKYGR